MSNQSIAVTRVNNSCVLLELGGRAVLTDPWFTERWWLRRGEPLGLRIEELPPLTAVVVTNLATNHWDLRALRVLPAKASTPLYVPTAGMARRARALGFARTERLRWGESRDLAPGLSLRVVPAGRTAIFPNNAYVFETSAGRVFFGGEIADAEGLEAYRPVELALLPVNGLRSPLGQRLVMGPEEAIAGAAALGARILVPVHDAHGEDPFSRMFRPRGTGADAVRLGGNDLVVADLPPGKRLDLNTMN
ncbi:MBL fold metallo-hydrolase [Kribbella solani]|uniref:L-ascorbate metabolism protein UlaG (Beta-lactamase superfamily) n=1 Tax=Kribbella solani TaxID=236067 RepID=A0A841DQ98_9ACTN|nr:MBL fold metallo-hydrolase [Kribbella solani]MBB5981314.1 L-ascorbate metabolism protein UlaG (beta-lactamase superfamily) [Kribbella solani]